MRILLSGAIFLAGSIAAHAGDFDAPADSPDVTAAVPVQQTTSWAGFYGGLSFSSVSGRTVENTSGGPTPDIDRDGALGGFIGYNWQRDNLVFGAEVNHTAADLEYVGFPDSSQDDVTELRGRVGYTPLDDLLIYGFLGYAETTLSDSGIVLDQSGMSFGFGADYMVWNNMFVGLELARRDVSGTTVVNTLVDTLGTEIDTISLRVGYKF